MAVIEICKLLVCSTKKNQKKNNDYNLHSLLNALVNGSESRYGKVFKSTPSFLVLQESFLSIEEQTAAIHDIRDKYFAHTDRERWEGFVISRINVSVIDGMMVLLKKTIVELHDVILNQKTIIFNNTTNDIKDLLEKLSKP